MRCGAQCGNKKRSQHQARFLFDKFFKMHAKQTTNETEELCFRNLIAKNELP